MKNTFIYKFVNGKVNRKPILFLFDTLCFAAVTAFYYVISLRASESMPVDRTRLFFINSGVQYLAVMLFRFVVGTYRNIWRYANSSSYFRIVIADAMGGTMTLLVIRFIFPNYYYGVWQAATVGAMSALAVLVSRFLYSMLYNKASAPKNLQSKVPVAIVGAGRLGIYLAGDLTNNPNSGYNPMFFIDNDPLKIGNIVQGFSVYGTSNAKNLIQKIGIKDIIVAITSKTSDELSEIYEYYSSIGCKVQIYESLINNGGHKGQIRDFTIEDLLFRKPIEYDSEDAYFYAGRTVMVTGGGGSIGSEICRQIAECHPKKLVIFDIYENNAYEIQQELIKNFGKKLDFSVEIGSVRDSARIDEVMNMYRPEIVFHAAAHKHVPLMENSSAEAIKNNCLGTYNVANAAEKYGVEKFILISTDKAVNPTNVMGASKRVCEMIVQCRTDSRTSFAAVRFGNVLGSNGSVIPLFKKQIAEGGPVTVTDKRIIRYFMTIPEASRLVLTAGAMAKSGELFVLDMGKPVKIYDLAVNMIKLSGFEPETDIEIKEIGLRPGEKLYEELLIKSEYLDKTENEKIFIERDTPLSREEVDEKLEFLLQETKCGGNIREALKKVVTTFHDPEEVNQTADASDEMKLTQAERVTV